LNAALTQNIRTTKAEFVKQLLFRLEFGIAPVLPDHFTRALLWLVLGVGVQHHEMKRQDTELF